MTHDDTLQPNETGRWSQNATTRKHRTGEASEMKARPCTGEASESNARRHPRSSPQPTDSNVPGDSDASSVNEPPSPYETRYPDRQSTRLRGYDYTRPGAYFITICTHGRECLFGDPEHGRMRLTTCGRIVVERWRALPRHFPHVTLDAFVVMPNHVHGIVVIKPPRKTTQSDPTPQNDVNQPTGTTPGSLGAVVQNLKSTASRKINRFRATPDHPVWQRGYYDRIIRDKRELNAVRNYIRRNPERWEEDRNHPADEESEIRAEPNPSRAGEAPEIKAKPNLNRTGETSETEARPNSQTTPSPTRDEVPSGSDASPQPIGDHTL